MTFHAIQALHKSAFGETQFPLNEKVTGHKKNILLQFRMSSVERFERVQLQTLTNVFEQKEHFLFPI